MKDFQREISGMTDINDLLVLKEKVKSQIITPSLLWEARIDLYKKVQLINERVQQL